MERIFFWHITGRLGFGLYGAWLTFLTACFNGIGLLVYAFVITVGVLLAFRVMP